MRRPRIKICRFSRHPQRSSLRVQHRYINTVQLRHMALRARTKTNVCVRRGVYNRHLKRGNFAIARFVIRSSPRDRFSESIRIAFADRARISAKRSWSYAVNEMPRPFSVRLVGNNVPRRSVYVHHYEWNAKKEK